MSITHEAYLNIVPGDSPAPIIKVSQYDADFSIVFHLIAKKRGVIPAYPRTVENDEDITINVPTSATVSVRGTKTDGNGYSANATLSGTATAPIVTVAGHEQMTASAGVNVYEITFYADNATKRLSTANFILFVEPAALDASTITSESLMLELNDLIASVPNAVAAADRAEAAAQSVSSSAAQIEQNRQNIATNAQDIATNAQDISDIKEDLSELEPGLSDDAKAALLACFRHIAFLDEDDDYYGNLESALYASEIKSITAQFSQSGNVFSVTDKIDDLRNFLVVKAILQDDTEEVVTDYELVGTLTAGTSIISAIYKGKNVQFSVTVSGLPSEYTEKQYVASDGTQYITTNILATSVVDCGFRQKSMVTQLSAKSGHLFSATQMYMPFMVYYNDTLEERSRLILVTRNGGNQKTNFTPHNEWELNEAYEIEAYLNGSDKIYVNGEYQYDNPKGSTTPNSNMALLTYSGELSDAKWRFRGRLYYIKVFNNDMTKLYDFVPCKKNSNNVVGLYDLVNGVFYPPAIGTLVSD